MKTEAPYVFKHLEENKFLSVAAIENGTVIDHITAGRALLLVRLLKLERHHQPLTIGLNLSSSRMKSKDILKVEGWDFPPKDLPKIAVFSPHATISIIQNFRVIRKDSVVPLEAIAHVIVCPNSNCVTNHETSSRLFYVKHERKDLLQCSYCEKCYSLNEVMHFAC
jgi:aspartate carbamoyltransferase regulatory subunit